MKSLYLFFVVLILFSCQTVRVEKRLHSRGYTVFWNKKMKTSGNDSEKQLELTTNYPEKKGEEIIAIETVSIEQTDSISSITSNESQELAYSKTDVGSQREMPHSDRANTPLRMNSEEQTSDDKVNIETSGSDNSKLAFLCFMFPFLIPLFLGKRNKKISLWASENKRKAQVSIGILSVTNVAAAYVAGHFFHDYGDKSMLAVSFLGTLVSLGIYGTAKRKSNKKKALALTSISSSMLAFSAGMLDDIYVEDTHILPTWAIVLLTVLLVAAFITGSFLMAALACNIACTTGEVFLSYAVLTVGWYLVGFLAAWGLLAAYKYQSQRGENVMGKAALYGLFGLIWYALFLIPLFG